MSNKTLSTGTLNLRFMQNALRRQQIQEVELERAEVKDEGRWEVGQDIKEAWGIEQETWTDDSIAYEQSYMPFLFSHEDEDAANSSISKPLGRRIFDENGQDISTSRPQTQIQQVTGANDSKPADGTQRETELDGDTPLSSSTQTPKPDEFLTKGRKLKAHTKPVPISSAFSKGLKGFNAPDHPSKVGRNSLPGTKTKNAREAIFDSMTGVGSDLRSTKYTTVDGEASKTEEAGFNNHPKQRQKRSQQLQQQPTATSMEFLKPMGVDEPTPWKAVPPSGRGEIPGKPASPDVINGAGEKRQRKQSDPGGTDKKNKKKRSTLSKEHAGLQ